MKTAKKVLALLLSVLMVFTMVSSTVVAVAETAPAEKTEIEDVENTITNAFDTVKGIIEGVHNLVGGILSMLDKECVFCDEVHGKAENDDEDTQEPTEPETPPSEPEVPVEPEEPTEPETPVEPEEPTEPEEPKEDEPTEDKIDNAFDSIGGLFDSIHNLVGSILAIFGKECPFCDKVHGKDEGETEEPDVDPEIVDTDKDGISDEEEPIYGTDINKADTDDDGFTDFEELFLMGTDPLKADEKDVDTDDDGLTDYDEVKKYGTDINSEDTDGDDLTDYDEVKRYSTDPTKKDTDDDGLSDAFEIENGLDPTKASTDGETSDADVKIEQTTDEESVSDALLDEDNVAKPSLEGEVAGDLSEKVFIATSPDCSLDDNRAVIGEPIVVDGDKDYVDDLKLNFDLSAYEGVLENLSICKLDEDGNISPVESELTGSSISCDAEADVTYFVMDIDAFLKALGVDLDAYKAMTFSLRGRSAEVAGDKVSGQADIVFAIDTTGSMSGTIYNVIANVKDFTERLATEYSVKVNYALIDYRDLEEDGPGTTKVIKNGTSNWFSNIDTYGSALNTLYADGGGDGPECSVDALETARRLDFRKSASKFVILITDADYKIANDYGIKSMDEVAEKLAADGINTSVVCSTYDKYLYENVYNTTGGIFADIYGNFSEELLKLADLIGEETSDGEWVILKHGYRYVKLPAIPTADSTADTDEDGISDYKELGKKVTVDLTKFIKAQLANNGVPFEVYTGKTSIEVYDSIADPTLYDTDGDGFYDRIDPTPWSATAFLDMEHYINYKYDNKPSVTVLVDQPIVGKRTAIDGSVGHSFILISDGMGNMQYTGFYPKSLTFIDIWANIGYMVPVGGCTNTDNEHDYDIAYSSSITFAEYTKVANYLENHKDDLYSLEQFNCTSFAVNAFAEGDKGIKSIIKRHMWSVPWEYMLLINITTLGGALNYPYGYSPADAGEDIRSKASEYVVKDSIDLAGGDSHEAVIIKNKRGGGGSW